MAVTESKVKLGKLTLGGGATPLSFACQPTSVLIATTYNETGEAVETLCGDQLPAATTASRTLNITAIQDFDNPDGLMRFLRASELTQVPFTWQASPTSEIASGNLEARLGDWGGAVGQRITTELVLPIITLTWADPPPPVALTAAQAEAAPPAGDRRKTTLTYDNSGTGRPVKVTWKTGATPVTITDPAGTVDHTYTAADDGSISIKVEDSGDPARVVNVTSFTIPYSA